MSEAIAARQHPVQRSWGHGQAVVTNKGIRNYARGIYGSSQHHWNRDHFDSIDGGELYSSHSPEFRRIIGLGQGATVPVAPGVRDSSPLALPWKAALGVLIAMLWLAGSTLAQTQSSTSPNSGSTVTTNQPDTSTPEK